MQSKPTSLECQAAQVTAYYTTPPALIAFRSSVSWICSSQMFDQWSSPLGCQAPIKRPVGAAERPAEVKQVEERDAKKAYYITPQSLWLILEF